MHRRRYDLAVYLSACLLALLLALVAA